MVLVLACGEANDAPTTLSSSGSTSSAPTTTAEPDTSDGTSAAPGSTSDDPSTTSGANPTSGTPSDTSDGGSTDTGTAPMGLPEVGSLVVLGDSISDGGGGSPFYYELLRDDLDAFYGGIQYVNRAESGSETDALLGQVDGLPGTLPGPVAVVITSGGNDMKSAILQVVAGLDGPARMAMQANIAAAHDALLAPGRFGPGVEVFIFEGNIYDASDGVGDFGDNDCAFGGGFPTIPTDPFFESWNAAIADTTTASGQTPVDMHGHFYGHGYANPPNWYASDCTHPSQLGHDELRRLFYFHVTGQML